MITPPAPPGAARSSSSRSSRPSPRAPSDVCGEKLGDVPEWSPPNGTARGTECASEGEAEPNDALVEANLPQEAELGTCTPLTFEGSVGGDVDAFYLWRDPCAKSSPSATLARAPEGVELCLFVACAVGRTSMDPNAPCADGSGPYRMANGVRGCCSTEGSVTVNANCESEYSVLGSRPEFDAYVVVDRREGEVPDGGTCTPYAVTVAL